MEKLYMVQKHTFATPAPAGLAVLAVATFGFGAVFLGEGAVEKESINSSIQNHKEEA
jgi:succinate-acetate transporter protein